MGIVKTAQPALCRLHIAFFAFVSFSVLVGAGCARTAAQTLSPPPVARLISASANELRSRRIAADNTAPRSDAIVSTPASPTTATPAERRAFEVTNEVRAKNGLLPLQWDPELYAIARSHSRNMSVLNFFSHRTPEGLRLRDRARLAGVHYRVIAENLAYNQGFEDPGAFAVERWTISPGHRANLLSAEFRSSAVGSFIAPDGTVFLTQLFILR